ncbi:snRNA-activating protein complex subunit 4 isoform 2-T2 [Spinachia spinachia]
MSLSLSAERDRIQRQVEQLEQNLSATHTELELLSDDESDGDDTEEERQSPLGLLAQREKIQSEIHNLEEVLGQHRPVCVSDDEDSSSSSSGESELALSESTDSCLQMNLVYQQVVQETLDQLETLLTHNHRQQKELLSQLSGPVKESSRERPAHPSCQKTINMYLGRFLKPYFKDKLTGLGPPANDETKEKASRLTGCLDDKKLKVKRWESWQKTLLIHAVTRDSLRRIIQPKLSKVDYLSQKLSRAAETDKEPLRQQMDSLEREIELLREKTEDQLVGDRFDEHDWQKISNIDFEGTRDAEDIRCFWQNFLHPSISKTKWSKEEVQQLKEISRRHGERDWETIATELGTGRTAFLCLQTFQRFVSDSLKNGPWTPDEDALLRELVDKMRIGNFIPYTQMSYFMEGRDPAQLIYRWNQVLDPSLKRGFWTKEEDQLLLNAVSRFGERDWWKIRFEVPGRTDSGCRDRYYDCLKAETKRGPFDQQEKELLQLLVEKHGVGRWAKIAAEIPHRNDAQCLREWKKLNKSTKPRPKRVKRQKKTQTCVTTRQLRRRKSPKEEESTEDEEVKVEYMDSDADEKKEVKESPQQGDQVEEDYTFSPLQEWIPTNKAQSSTLLSFRLVELPSSSQDLVRSADQHQVRSTILGRSSRSAILGPSPRQLQWTERHATTAMMMVSPDQLRAYLRRQVEKLERRSSPRKVQHSRQNPLGGILDPGLFLQLQAAVTPWIGNVLIPHKSRVTAADALRGREEDLLSTPVFMLLLQAMNVDAVGCKEMIGQRRNQVVATPPAPGHASNKMKRKTVKEEQQTKQILKQLQRNHPPPQSCPVLSQMPPRMSPVSFPQDVFIPHSVAQPAISSFQLMTTSSPSPQRPPPVGVLPRLFPPAPLDVLSPSGGPLPLTRNQKAAHQHGSLQERAPVRTPVLASTRLLPQTPPSCVTTPTAPLEPPPAQLVSSPSSPPVSLKVPLPLNATSSCSNRSSLHDPSLVPPPSTPTYQLLAPSHSGLPVVHDDHCYIQGRHLVNSIQSPCNPASNKHPKALPRRSTRSKGEEPAAVSRCQEGQCVGGACGTCVTQKGKRVRNPTARARALQEAAQEKVEAKNKRSSPRNKRCRSTGPDEVFSQPPGFCLRPGQSMWVTTPHGLIQLAQAPPQGLQLTLVPSAPFSAPPGQLIRHTLFPPAGSVLNQLHPIPAFSLPQPISHPGTSASPSHRLRPPPKLLIPKMGRVGVKPAAPPQYRREALQFDPSLIFLDTREAVRDWLSGRGGVAVGGGAGLLPYLPPCVSSLNTLSALLRAKKVLTSSSLQLLGEGAGGPPDSTSDLRSAQDPSAPPPLAPSVSPDLLKDEEAQLVVAMRQLVAERFSCNPAYQLLKARFLSCFTVPALLATVQPIRAKPGPAIEEDKEEEELKKFRERCRQRRADRTLLLCDGSGALANHFSGTQGSSPFPSLSS